MKYVKADLDYKLEDMPHGKIRLYDDEDFAETPWVKKATDHVVLVNDALMFMPYRSWGVVLRTTSGSLNPLKLIGEGVLELHPEAWEQMLKYKLMDEEGNPNLAEEKAQTE